MGGASTGAVAASCFSCVISAARLDREATASGLNPWYTIRCTSSTSTPDSALRVGVWVSTNASIRGNTVSRVKSAICRCSSLNLLLKLKALYEIVEGAGAPLAQNEVCIAAASGVSGT